MLTASSVSAELVEESFEKAEESNRQSSSRKSGGGKTSKSHVSGEVEVQEGEVNIRVEIGQDIS